ncbi:V-type H+-transporting ATPase 16kDa proteolipid subunit [Nematocida homosporus]|uniref:V-type H+-transporting ATPase 16kDa proteolipid subunit n=1 Tax=Nematocida homosporus TaxID=1912981 RepID=UPI00221FDC3D|nr:V-type H+-transporting ATPase 16kDa proteolipid subunit [Nematocida homosporus]KAI5186451.1 V-type H+-transporting ATPase 16kDa proteolipid subunit [Nematocida homosporus]
MSSEFQALNIEAIPFIMAVLGLSLMIILSAAGATIGSVKAASAAAMVSHRSNDILTKAYLPVLLSSAVFMYAMIISVMAIGKIESSMGYHEAGLLLAAGVIYGVASLFTGMSIGASNKESIVQLSGNKHMFISYLVMNSTMELPAVFSLICAIMLISQK